MSELKNFYLRDKTDKCESQKQWIIDYEVRKYKSWAAKLEEFAGKLKPRIHSILPVLYKKWVATNEVI